MAAPGGGVALSPVPPGRVSVPWRGGRPARPPSRRPASGASAGDGGGAGRGLSRAEGVRQLTAASTRPRSTRPPSASSDACSVACAAGDAGR
jgi:hypothetical protein